MYLFGERALRIPLKNCWDKYAEREQLEGRPSIARSVLDLDAYRPALSVSVTSRPLGEPCTVNEAKPSPTRTSVIESDPDPLRQHRRFDHEPAIEPSTRSPRIACDIIIRLVAAQACGWQARVGTGPSRGSRASRREFRQAAAMKFIAEANIPRIRRTAPPRPGIRASPSAV